MKQKEKTILKGHNQWIFSIRISPDNKYLASGGADNTVRIWDVANWKEISMLKGHTDWIFALDFSKDKKYLASGSYDNTIKIWEPDIWREIITLQGHNSAIWSTKFSPDGKYLATSSHDSKVKLWDTDLWKEVITLEENSSPVLALHFSPGTKFLAGATYDGEIKIWEMSSWQKIITLKGHKKPVWTVEFSPDNKYIVSGDEDGVLKIWEIEKWQELVTLKNKSCVWTVKFSPDSKCLAIGIHKMIKIFETGSWKEISKIKCHNDYVKSLDFSPDSKIIVTGGIDKTIKLWDNPVSLPVVQPVKETKPKLIPTETIITTTTSAVQITPLIAEKYEIIKEIGRGGMGIVYEAVNRPLEMKVAIKKMRPELSISRREVDRFLREAKLVAQLKHPNIVGIHDIIEEEGTVYLVFEFVEGESLSTVIDKQGRLDFGASVEIIKKVCEAFVYAHTQGIVHRDLKPSNIVVEPSGIVKVMDFGIARVVKDTVSRVSSETTGTLAYMAPEQHLGTSGKATDIFSLGVTLYEMLTGELPYPGPDFYLQKKEMTFRTPSEILPEIKKDLEEIIKKCLQPDPAYRFTSAQELLVTLNKVITS